MKIYSVFSVMVMVLLFSGLAFAFNEPQYSSNFLLSVLFKAQELRNKATMEIRKMDTEIKKNEVVIQKSEKIISLARQKGNTQAEMVARDALMKATGAKRKNEETKEGWKLRKIKADRSYAAIRNMLSQNRGPNRQMRGFVTDYAGSVNIFKANGDKPSPENGLLEPGDRVLTDNGSAEIQMLQGRASAKIGPYSEFTMKKDTPQEQVVELLKGRVYMAVDKIDVYAKNMREKIDQYKEDLQTIEQLNKEDMNDLKNYLEKRKSVLVHLGNPCLQVPRDGRSQCVTAVCAVRGTKFTGEIKDSTTYEVTVLEGIVDVTIPEKDTTLSVVAGNKATIGLDDGIKVEKIEHIQRWWEE